VRGSGPSGARGGKNCFDIAPRAKKGTTTTEGVCAGPLKKRKTTCKVPEGGQPKWNGDYSLGNPGQTEIGKKIRGRGLVREQRREKAAPGRPRGDHVDPEPDASRFRVRWPIPQHIQGKKGGPTRKEGKLGMSQITVGEEEPPLAWRGVPIGWRRIEQSRVWDDPESEKGEKQKGVPYLTEGRYEGKGGRKRTEGFHTSESQGSDLILLGKGGD